MTARTVQFARANSLTATHVNPEDSLARQLGLRIFEDFPWCSLSSDVWRRDYFGSVESSHFATFLVLYLVQYFLKLWDFSSVR